MLLEAISRKAANAPLKLIEDCENGFREKLDALAHAVASDRESRPVVLLSGPSGSGKTTTAHKLEERLERMGLETHIVSMDNYFRTFNV